MCIGEDFACKVIKNGLNNVDIILINCIFELGNN